MEPITSSELFEEDPSLGVTEMEDGSAVVELPEDEAAEIADFYSNLAEELDQFVLNTTASDLLDLLEKDKEARKKRDEQYTEGIRRTGLGDDAPGGAQFEGASKVVHPVLAEGCVDFSARAIKELFPANGPVRTKIIGEADEKKLEKAKNKRDFLNWLTVNKIEEYRAEKEILLTQLPLGGSQYEKYWRDPKKKRACMEFVPVDKVLLPYSASSFYTTPRLTHIQEITRDEFESRIATGFYKDINLTDPQSPEETAAEKATDKVEGLSENAYNEDGLRTVFEISVDLDLEDSGELCPYIIHLDESTRKIVAVYRNWEEDDESFQRLDWWVEDKFIPWRGAYGIGLPHLIGGLAAALTGALRALLDSAHINNSPGAVKLKGGRTSGQNIQVAQTEIAEVEAPAGVDDIRKIMMPLPFNPPSTVLFQLLDWITGQAKGVVATAEERIADAGNNMPVGTTLALIEQGSQVFSSIHSRLHESQRRALLILCRLVRQYPEDYAEQLQKLNLRPEDFAVNDDIQPVSDPNIFSEAQRYAQLQEQIKVMGMFPDLKWNRNEIARRALELLRTDGIESMLPKEEEPVTADPVQENVSAANGVPLKASLTQDHMAHVMTHVGYVLNPIHQLNPMPQPYLMAILGHVSEHLNLFYEITSQAHVALVYQQAQANGEELNGDQIAMRAARMAQQLIAETLKDVVPMIQQATQFAQSKAPKPSYPPEVQATLDAAMAQINQKAEADKANNALRAQELQGRQSLDAMQMQAEQTRQQFEQQLAMTQEENKKNLALFSENNAKAIEDVRQHIEMMKNSADNQQHQMTELLKNRDDNQTAVLIEKLKQMMPQVTPTAETAQAPQNDAMLKQMTEMLNQIKEAKTNDALTATVEGLRTLMEGQRGHQENMISLAQQLMSGE